MVAVKAAIAQSSAPFEVVGYKPNDVKTIAGAGSLRLRIGT
ncbi:hypothetical protein [Paenibacillus sp. 1011MAR3C5]|nr:hypothetical protein [Paenibacillus sp. 1011MAR3C5]